MTVKNENTSCKFILLLLLSLSSLCSTPVYANIPLRKNFLNGVNTLTQSMISDANTTYIIEYDYILGEDITIPPNCELNFAGGSIKGNRITFNNTLLSGDYKISCGIDGTISNKSLDYKGLAGCDLIELCSAIRYCTLDLRNYSFDLKTDLILNAGTCLIGGIITTSAHIKNEGGYTNSAFGSNRADIKRLLSVKANKDTRTITLTSVDGLAVGDYVKICNGYGSLWRILETGGINSEWALNEKTIWDYQINIIEEIKGNTLYLKNNLEYDFPIKATKSGYDIFPADKPEQLGRAFVSKIGQVKDITLDGCTIRGRMRFVCCNNLVVKNCDLECLLEKKEQKTLLLSTCINSKVINNKVKANGTAISLESQTYNTVVKGNTCWANGGYDACILTMLGVSQCHILNNTVIQNNNKKIGIYLNTSKNNYVTDNIIKDCYEAIRCGYSFGGAMIRGNVAYNCSVYWINHARNDTLYNNRIFGCKKSNYVANGFNLSSCRNVVVDSMIVDATWEQSRIKNVVDCSIRNYKGNGLYILKTDTSISFPFGNYKAYEISDSEFDYVIVADGDKDDNTGFQEKIYKRCTFLRGMSTIGYNANTHHNRFYECSFKNEKSTPLVINTDKNTFVNCVFDGKEYDVYVAKGKKYGNRRSMKENDFQGSRFVHNKIKR